MLERLEIATAHLVLHDFRGPWGLAWAAAHPERFVSATLINTGVLPDYRWHHLARIWRTPVLGELFMLAASKPAARLLLGHDNPRLSREAIDRIYLAARTWPTQRAIPKLYRATPGRAMRGPIEVLRGLDRPALVLWGTADAFCPGRWPSASGWPSPPRTSSCSTGSGTGPSRGPRVGGRARAVVPASPGRWSDRLGCRRRSPSVIDHERPSSA